MFVWGGCASRTNAVFDPVKCRDSDEAVTTFNSLVIVVICGGLFPSRFFGVRPKLHKL